MKIYSNRSTGKFDKFLGKDLWVKILSPAMNRVYFCRFLYKDDDGDYVCNRLVEYYVENPGFWGPAIKGEISMEHYLFPDRYELAQPVEAYTTEELFGNILKEG